MKLAKKRGHRIFTGIAGEYFVAAELSRRGVVVTITSKNTPDIDLLASDPDGNNLVQIQIKTGRSDSGGFIVGSSAMKKFPKNTYYVFVFLQDDNPPEYWIIPYDVVAEIVEREHKEWLRGRDKKSEKAPLTLSWNHLKTDLRQYQNNWEVLGILNESI